MYICAINYKICVTAKKMTTIASQITSLTVVYSTVYSDANQRKHQSSASLAFVWGIHRDRWIPRTKGQLRGICFHLMMSSCYIMTQTTGRWIPLGNDWIFVWFCPDQRSVGGTWIKLGLSIRHLLSIQCLQFDTHGNCIPLSYQTCYVDQN